MLRTLVVEDSAPTRAALSDWLDALGGFSVVGTAASETEATDWLDRHRLGWDVAIVDLLIEGGSGFNLIRRARQSSSSGGVVVFSAYITPVVAQRCIDLGAIGAFNKSEPEKMLRFLGALKLPAPGRLQKGQP